MGKRTKPGGAPRGRRKAAAEPSLLDALRGSLAAVLADVGQIVDSDDPVAAEALGSSVLGVTYGQFAPGLDLEEMFPAAMTDLAERDGSREALALLLALAAVMPDDAHGQAARAAAERLEQRGLAPPAWAASAGMAAFAGAWLGTEPLGDQDLVVLGFQHEGRPPHALQLLIDHNLGGMIKDAVVLDSVAEVLDGWRLIMPEVRMRQIAGADAASRVGAGLEMSDRSRIDSPATEDFRSLRALIEDRLRRLPEPVDRAAPEPLGEDERARLVDEFQASPEAATVAAGRRTTVLSASLVDYRADYGDGDPLRWSPTVVELLLCDWFPRKMLRRPGDAEELPNVLRAWVRFAARRRELPAGLLRETLESVDTFLPEFVRLMARTFPRPAPEAGAEATDVNVDQPAGAEAWLSELYDIEDDDELTAALNAEDDGAVEVLREALTDQLGLPPPRGMLDAAESLRPRLSKGGDLQYVKRAAGWKRKLPADGLELWLGAMGALVDPQEATGLDLDAEAALIVLEHADWAGAVIGLVRRGVGAPADPVDLLAYIDECPEIDGELDSGDVSVVKLAFELALRVWEAGGAVDRDGRLTDVGLWGLPRALARAWRGDLDA